MQISHSNSASGVACEAAAGLAPPPPSGLRLVHMLHSFMSDSFTFVHTGHLHCDPRRAAAKHASLG